jgi:hypothetical protein
MLGMGGLHSATCDFDGGEAMSLLTTVPEVCMQYTQVFRAVKLETGIAVIVGILIGVLLMWMEGKR